MICAITHDDPVRDCRQEPRIPVDEDTCPPDRLISHIAAAARPRLCIIRRTIRIDPAPSAGSGPGGEVFPGQSGQTRQIAVPRNAVDCNWELKDAVTGAFPSDPFPGQTWELLFAALVRPADWSLSYRILNYAHSGENQPPRLWQVTLRCLIPPGRGPGRGCSAHALRGPAGTPNADEIQLDFHCGVRSTGFRVRLPAGYRIARTTTASNTASSGTFRCALTAAATTGGTEDCSGITPPETSSGLVIRITPLPPAGFAPTVDIRLGANGTVSVNSQPHEFG
jgi:hypothetical protein